jgi:hypothetical protein
MKKLRLYQTCWVIAFAAPSWPAQAQEDMRTRTIETTYTIDERGDAVVEEKTQMGAADWMQWREQYGDHPDLVLRNLRYQMAGAVLEDYSLEKDDVQRRYVAKVKARALARYRSKGDFSIDVPKDFNLVTGSGTDWFFTASAPTNGVLVSATIKAKLPSKATNASFSPAGDINLLTYSIDVTPLKPKGWLIGGIALLSLGVVLGICSTFPGKRATTTVTIIPPPPSSPPPVSNLPSGP